MSRQKIRKSRAKAGRQVSKKTHVARVKEIEPDQLAKRERYFEFFVIAALFAFGVYHSVLYFGHKVVPNPDFPGFTRVARQLLSLQVPGSFKRAPGLGFLVVFLSNFTGGPSPDLTAGWLLGAILHPFNVILLWLVGKRIIGRSAMWVAIIAAINPWVVYSLTEPVVETTLLFFVLLTSYFIFRRSRWCYLFASMTAMVRYEGAALIMAAFVIDMISCENKSKRIRALVYAAAATVPLAMWMLGTVINWQSQAATHYLKELGVKGAFGETLSKYISLIWQVGFYPLFVPVPTASKDTVEVLLKMSRMLVAVSLAFGTVYGLYKRRWNILVLLIFFVPYILVHTLHSYVFTRFCTTVNWIVLLLCLYGLQSFWQLINKDGRIPKAIIVVLQGVLLVSAFAWLIQLVPYLPKIAPISRRSVSMPYVAMGVVAVIFAARRFIYRARYSWRDLSVSALVCLMVVSNQFVLARIMGDGQLDAEFKMLADWYRTNTERGEKLATTMSGIIRMFVPDREEDVMSMSCEKAENPMEYVSQCYERNITYIAWDSRVGYNPDGRYYKLWKMKNVAMLVKPQTLGPYEFVTQIRASKRRFVNIFRLHKPPPNPATDGN